MKLNKVNPLLAAAFAAALPLNGALAQSLTTTPNTVPITDPSLAGLVNSETKEKIGIMDFEGKTLVVFFGFSSCTDTCYPSMRYLTDVLNALESGYGSDVFDKALQNTRFVMVSTDPKDTPAKMMAWHDKMMLHSRIELLTHDQNPGLLCEVGDHYNNADGKCGVPGDHVPTFYVVESDSPNEAHVAYSMGYNSIYEKLDSVFFKGLAPKRNVEMHYDM